jgi:hypothetical protein
LRNFYTGTSGSYTINYDNWTFNGSLNPTVGRAVNHGATDLLHRDFIRSKDPADYATGYPGNDHFPYANPDTRAGQFRVDLPNGDYMVTVISGDYDEYRTVTGGPSNEGRTAMTFVEAEGLPVLYGARGRGGYFSNRAFRTTVTDGHLDLVFSGKAVGPLYCNPIEWMINGLVIQTTSQTPTPEAQAYLGKAEVLSDSAIRDWYVIGPFDDNDCNGLEVIFGPEDSNDLNNTYQGKNGTVSWQLLPTLVGDAPYVSLSDTFSDANETAGFAMTHVYCPSSTEAVLVASISQVGDIYVNGRKVFRDELATGLLLEEQYVNITLNQGWNPILIKSLNHWGSEWSLWAGLLTTEGQPLTDQAGITISAGGNQ